MADVRTEETRFYARRAGERLRAESARVGPEAIGRRLRLARAHRRARGLGWFSIGLGLAQILSRRGLARMIGVGDDRWKRTAMLAVGAREIAAGIGILRGPRPAGWLWARVAGDLMDLALLGSALRSRNTNPARVGASMAALAGVTALDFLTSRELGRAERHEAARASRSITVNRSLEQVYGFWRDLENLPRFMANLESVRALGEQRSRWIVAGPAGARFEWEAEIVEDRPGELIAWRSIEGADLPNAGTVRFARAPGGRGTEIHLELEYDPPVGRLGAQLAKLFGKDPGQQIERDLRRFKQVLETGEVVHSDASIHRGPHPARPSEGTIRRGEGGRR
jgi:uncharacterized membrane protein